MTNFTTSEQAAVTALALYDPDRYNAITNPTGLAGDGYKTNFTAACSDTATAANAVERLSEVVDTAATAVLSASAGAPSTTSTTALAIATGSLAFTVISTGSFITGMWVRAFSQADPTKYVWGIGTVTSSTIITLAVILIGGSGTISDWKLIATGPNGATTGIAALVNDTAPKLGADLHSNGHNVVLDTGDKITFASGSAGSEMAGALLNNAVLGPTLEKITSLGSVMNTVTPNCTVASHFKMVLAGNVTLAMPTTLTTGTIRGITLQVRQAPTGVAGEPFDITWPASVKWPGGTPPIVSAVLDATDIFILRASLNDGGSVVYAPVVYGQGFVGL